MPQKVQSYKATDIQVLEDLEAVRRRPGMFIGSTDQRGLHQLVYELVNNSVDEAMAGACDRIEVTIHEDSSVTVEDNGRGIPVGIHPELGKSALEVVHTTLHSGAKFSNHIYKMAGGLHGVGVACVNALSEWLTVEVKRGGKLYRQRYVRGKPVTPVEVVGKAKGTGTKTTFLPDSSIMETLDYDFDTLAQRFREMAFLNRGLHIKFVDERHGREMSFYFEGGITSFVRYLNRGREVLHEPISIEVTHPLAAEEKADELIVEGSGGIRQDRLDGCIVEATLQWREEGGDEIFFSFANGVNTVDGGTHVTGFRSALTRAINDYARAAKLLKLNEESFTGEDVRWGLTAVLSVKLPEPQFESQTKSKLGNSEVRFQVESVIYKGLADFLEKNRSAAKRIIEACRSSAKARRAAQKARELVIRKSTLEVAALPGKLADCSEEDPERAELFIVEGDSAGGSAKQGRDRHFQAVLPLRGKILNTERAHLNKILSNDELKALIAALGVGIGREFDLTKLRYGKVIITTDADVDGAHIRTLLLTFFYRHMRPLIESGHLYIAQPPLYRIAHGGGVHYAYTEAEKERIIKKLGKESRVVVQRFKGLGEMNPTQLWETTMDPQSRTLLQVTIEDAAKADRVFEKLMGPKVPPRRRFIQTHAKEVKNLDV